MPEHKDYLSSLNKARRKRNQCLDFRYLVLLLTAIVATGIVVLGVKPVKKPVSGKAAGSIPTGQVGSATPAQADSASVSPEEEAAQKEAQEIDNVISSYSNLGIMQVSGYLNTGETPSTDGKIVGKLSGSGTYKTLATEGDQSHVTSNGVEDYINNQYLLIGDETREKVKEFVKLCAAVTADNLNIRQAPALDPENVIGQALKGGRYVVKRLEGGWVQIEEGCASFEYAKATYSLNEGCKMDMKAMTINQYDDLVIFEMNSYLNVRQEPKSGGKIISKMTSKAASEILEALDGWYKTKLGPIIGYISADPQCTVIDQKVKNIVMQDATLKAVINTDVLNVRAESNTEAKIQTQIVKDERYPVVAQLDDWVEVGLDSMGEEDGSKVDKTLISTKDNNVEACYALNEAIKFSPAEATANSMVSRHSRVVNYVLQFMGNPYVWGGTSLVKGVDCSGFTIQVMKQFGVSPPYYSDSQVKMGKAVTPGSMRPGDSIFHAGNGGQVNHVAIYIGGDQVICAASRKSDIKIFTQNYRSSIAVRNVLGGQIKKMIFCSESRSTVSADRLFLHETL